MFFPTPIVIGKVVAGKLLQPINKSYITNFANVWTALQDPFYDKGSQLLGAVHALHDGDRLPARQDRSRPTTGASCPTATDLLWDPKYKGRTYILDDDREALWMALLRRGITDVNTEDPTQIDQALADLEPARFAS